jgi:regulatory protein
MGVDEGVVAALGLRVGLELDEEELQRIVRAELVSKAKERALGLLGYRPRSRAELTQRLSRAGYAEDIIEEAVSRLEDIGLIDDAQFSRSWVNSRVSGKGIGKARIKWELRRKGVASDVVEEALSELSPDAERELASDAASRRWERDKDTDERAKRRRVASYLRRQGFEWQVITEVLDNLAREDDPT